MKTKTVNGKLTITLDGDETLIQHGSKVEIQTKALLSEPNLKKSSYGVVNNPKNEDGHVFALLDRNKRTFLLVDKFSKIDILNIEGNHMYDMLRDDIVSYRDNFTTYQVSYDNYTDALKASTQLMIELSPLIVDIVEFKQETGSVIKIH